MSSLKDWWMQLDDHGDVWRKTLLRAIDQKDAPADFQPSAEELDALAAVEVVELYVGREKRISLAPIEGMANLREILLSGFKEVEGLELLASRPSLTAVSAINCGIKTVELFAGIPDLRHLNLNSNSLESLDGLEQLASLEHLEVSDNRIADATPVSRLTNLRVLDLSENRLDDIDFVSGLSQLEELNVGRNNLDSIAPVAKLSQLRVLDVSAKFAEGTSTDLTPVGSLSNLERLDISSHAFDDVSVLSNCPNLQRLRCVGMASDVQGIKELIALSELESIHGGDAFKKSQMRAFKKSRPDVDVR